MLALHAVSFLWGRIPAGDAAGPVPQSSAAQPRLIAGIHGSSATLGKKNCQFEACKVLAYQKDEMIDLYAAGNEVTIADFSLYARPAMQRALGF
jgi:hypothetical protein